MGVGGVLGDVVDGGIPASAVIARFLLGEMRKQTIHGLSLSRGADIGSGFPVEMAAGGAPVQNQHGADEDFIDGVSHMGKSQGGDGVYLPGR